MKKTVLMLLVFFLLGVSMMTAQDFTTGEQYQGIDDKGNNGSSKVKVETMDETIGGTSYFTATMTGQVTTRFQYGFIQMRVDATESELARLKSGKGIKFKCTGDGKQYRMKIAISNVKDYDHYGYIFTASSKPQEIVVMYSDLKQEGWGKKTGFTAGNIQNLEFQTIGQPHKSIELKVYDFEIIE